VLVKGGEYKIEDIVGHDLVLASGGKVLTIEMTPGYSSTGLISRLNGSS
jgi:bifunctional ADP-heptose synthase (sugar kinase/adenylyltransferase)